MGSYQKYVAPPCPNCGKEDGARMGSTVWGHNYSCCSDKCGLEYRTSPKRYQIELAWARARVKAEQERVTEWERLLSG